MVKVRNFDENLERSLEKLGKQIEEERKLPHVQKLTEKEIVKRSLKSLTPVGSISPPGPPTEGKPPLRKESVLPSYLQKEDGDQKVKVEVERLVNLVFSRGLEAALKEASKYPPFTEDAFHDALVDKLLPELKRKGIIK